RKGNVDSCQIAAALRLAHCGLPEYASQHARNRTICPQVQDFYPKHALPGERNNRLPAFNVQNYSRLTERLLTSRYDIACRFGVDRKRDWFSYADSNIVGIENGQSFPVVRK